MAKTNFSKAERAFSDSLRKIYIDRLSDLASIANLVQDAQHANLEPAVVADIIGRFQKELKKLKHHDLKLYKKLDITEEEEVRFQQSSSDYKEEDWLKMKILKEKIEELKGDLYGQTNLQEEDAKRIAEERLNHINKRFNIRKGWLPLH